MNNNLTKGIYFQEELLGKLTYAAYRIVLKSGIKKPFLEVELELWKSLRKVMKEMFKSRKTKKNSIIYAKRNHSLSFEN